MSPLLCLVGCIPEGKGSVFSIPVLCFKDAKYGKSKSRERCIRPNSIQQQRWHRQTKTATKCGVNGCETHQRGGGRYAPGMKWERFANVSE